MLYGRCAQQWWGFRSQLVVHVGLLWFLCLWLEKPIEQTIEFPVIWDVTTLTLRHCYDLPYVWGKHGRVTLNVPSATRSSRTIHYRHNSVEAESLQFFQNTTIDFAGRPPIQLEKFQAIRSRMNFFNTACRHKTHGVCSAKSRAGWNKKDERVMEMYEMSKSLLLQNYSDMN